MSETVNFIKENIQLIIVIVVVVLFLLVLINLKGIDLNEPKPESKLVQQVTVETFSTENINNDNDINIKKMLSNSSTNFCESYLGNASGLESSCNQLTENNCGEVGCCVYIPNVKNGKCVAGNKNGPTYKTDKDGKLITIDSYYYLGKCQGACI